MEGTNLHRSGSCLKKIRQTSGLYYTILYSILYHTILVLKKGLCPVKLRLKIGNVCHKRALGKIIFCLKFSGITQFQLLLLS